MATGIALSAVKRAATEWVVWTRIRRWSHFLRRTGAHFAGKCSGVVDDRIMPLLRVDASPHCLALGLAVGIFMATTPFLGLQVCGAVGLAWLFGGHVPAAIIGTFWANPVTYPLLLAASYRLGATMLDVPETLNLAWLADGVNAVVAALFVPGRSALAVAYHMVLPVAMPLTLGAFVIGVLSGAVFYVIARHAIAQLRVGSAYELK